MNRRAFIKYNTAGLAGLGLGCHPQTREPVSANHIPVSVIKAPPIPLPEDKRAPFGWTTAAIGDGAQGETQLGWSDTPEKVSAFRLPVAIDERDEKLVEARLSRSGRLLGIFDIRFPAQFQIFEIPLKPEDGPDIVREGVSLKVTKGSPLEIFKAGKDLPAALRPHLLSLGSKEARSEFISRLGSLACVQHFGWMEGCVLDGLWDLSQLPEYSHLKEVEARHLDLFFRDGDLIYENHRSQPSDNRIYGIEGTLPFASLARHRPESPLHKIAVDFWLSRQDAEGAIIDGNHTSSEGCYTVAYPLALIARARDDRKLEELALKQLRLRQDRLFDGETFWRTSDHSGTEIVKKGNQEWARGIAWQLLGMARTMRVLKDSHDIEDLIVSFQELAGWTLNRRRADGLWSVFTGEKDLDADTGGSAGLAAAFAIGYREGWLDASFLSASQKASDTLTTHLTPDGFLGGVAQANKGGEELQRGNYRVIYQMASGLMAQLITALESPETGNSI